MAGMPKRRARKAAKRNPRKACRRNPSVYETSREIARYAMAHAVTAAGLRSRYPVLGSEAADVIARNAAHLKREYGSQLRSDEYAASEAENALYRLVLGEIQ